MMTRRAKQYILHTGGPNGLTNQSKYYTHSYDLIEVRAVSIKQAYYLAGNGVWMQSVDDVGIAVIRANKGSRSWDGRTSPDPWGVAWRDVSHDVGN